MPFNNPYVKSSDKPAVAGEMPSPPSGSNPIHHEKPVVVTPKVGHAPTSIPTGNAAASPLASVPKAAAQAHRHEENHDLTDAKNNGHIERSASPERIPLGSCTTRTYPTDNSYYALSLPRSTPNRPMIRRDVTVTVVPTPCGELRITKHSATYVQLCPPSSS